MTSFAPPPPPTPHPARFQPFHDAFEFLNRWSLIPNSERDIIDETGDILEDKMHDIYRTCPTLVRRMHLTKLQFFKAECLSLPLKMRQYIL